MSRGGGRARTDASHVRARNGALERRTAAAEEATELGRTAIRKLVHELVTLARGGSLELVRLPVEAADALGNRGDKAIREICNRARYSVTLTRNGYQLTPIVEDGAEAAPPVDLSQPTNPIEDAP